MSEENIQCTENAKVQLPWGGKIYKFCPAHANKVAFVSQAMGAPLRAELLSADVQIRCESFDPLTDKEREMNKEFPALVTIAKLTTS